MLTNWITFVKAHEKLLLVFAGLAVVGLLFNKYENYSHDEAVGKNAIAQQQLTAQIEQNKQLIEQFATMKADFDKQQAERDKREIALLTSIASRNQQTTNQQHVDQTLPLMELAKRWALLVNVPVETIQVSGNTLSASEQTSRTTVQTLEEIPTLRANVKDQETLIQNKDQQITGLAGLNTSLTAQVVGLDKTLVDEKNACTGQINLIKSKARRSKVKAFAIGVGVGVAIGVKLAIL